MHMLWYDSLFSAVLTTYKNQCRQMFKYFERWKARGARTQRLQNSCAHPCSCSLNQEKKHADRFIIKHVKERRGIAREDLCSCTMEGVLRKRAGIKIKVERTVWNVNDTMGKQGTDVKERSILLTETSPLPPFQARGGPPEDKGRGRPFRAMRPRIKDWGHGSGGHRWEVGEFIIQDWQLASLAWPLN